MNKLNKQKLFDYAEKYSWNELVELLECADASEELGLDGVYKFIDSGRGLQGFDSDIRASIFEINGQIYGILGNFDSWNGTTYSGEIVELNVKEVKINQYSIKK